jgi:hypothetical protein
MGVGQGAIAGVVNAPFSLGHGQHMQALDTLEPSELHGRWHTHNWDAHCLLASILSADKRIY